MNTTFFLPDFVSEILFILKSHLYEAYIVGGSVRDLIMGNKPHDYDITTNALPEQVISLFQNSYKVIKTGIKHGTVTVMCKESPVEITTYRIEGNYVDFRRPADVTFTRSLEEDLKRRDFTINALVYNCHDGLVDYFDGINDINRKIIKCIGNPMERFSEDALRILRAMRFSVKLDFDIEHSTSAALIEAKHLLARISSERIFSELNVMFAYDNTNRLNKVLLKYKDVLCTVLSNIASEDEFADICSKTVTLPADNSLRLVYFLCRISKNINCLKKNLTTLKVSKAFFSRCVAIQSILSDCLCIEADVDAKMLIRKYGIECCSDAAVILNCTNKDERLLKVTNKVTEFNQCVSIKQLAVSGDDLIREFNIAGKDIGRILNELLTMVIREEIENENRILLEVAGKLL